MSYTEPLFIYFILLALALIALLPYDLLLVAIVLLSLVFCASFSLKSFIFILAYSLLVYGLSIILSNRKYILKHKFVFPFCCLLAISPLLYYKYSSYMLQIALKLFGSFPQYELEITMPIGISFVTFQALAYLADVYRGEIAYERSFLKSTLFLAFFPKLVAGPIVRAKEFFPQLVCFQRLDRRNTITGVELFLVGCFKKTVIADSLAPLVGKVFSNPGQFDAMTLWGAALAYTIQIYADFSGYTDMARGVSRIVGIELPGNFNWPYFSQSIRDFWRRWHITLSQWLRDYIYIPLGGSKVSPMRLAGNILVTWVICGLWHGASFTFILWGLYHGFFILIERTLHISVEHRGQFRFLAIPRALGTFVIVLVGWILFRANSYQDALTFLQRLFSFDAYSVDRFVQADVFSVWHGVLALAMLFAHFTAFRCGYDVNHVAILPRLTYPLRLAVMSITILLLIIAAQNQENFIYALF